MTFRQRLILFSLFACALVFQYCYKLDGTGVLEPDEPRYASIGREMALHGDWITPHLWGSPWFEKPPLIYWMAALGNLSGLNADLAGRLPVALLSLLFLAAWYGLLTKEAGEPAAAVSTLLLATSAAWIVYSDFCITDLPMSVFFSLALLLALRLLRDGQGWWTWFGMGASLGLAALAKGFVPLVLALPLAWFLRREWRRWWVAVAALCLVAGPWYVLVFAKNGFTFIQVFFLQQQFSRMYSEALQHVRPVYFYLPVLLASIFPWTPLLFVLRPRSWRRDSRALCMASVVGFGFVFFSLSLNKLPGYVLPLLPALFGLIGIEVCRRQAFQDRRLLITCGVLIALIPFAGQTLPALLTTRFSFSQEMLLTVLPITSGMLILFFVPVLVAAFAHRAVAWLLLVACCSISIVQLKASIFPVLDQVASPRGFWREIQPKIDQVCDAGLHRTWAYGLAFYAGKPVPICDLAHRPWRLVQNGAQRARVERAEQGKQ